MLAFYMSLVDTEEEKSLIEKLYNTYERRMYNVAFGILHNKQDAEDAVHESFLRIIKNISKISDPDCPKTKSFLFIIVRNVAINIYNDRKKRFSEPLEEAYDIGEDDIETQISKKNRLEQLKCAFNTLPEQYREILFLHLKLDLDINEISSMLGISYDAAAKRLSRAKGRLSELLKESDEE